MEQITNELARIGEQMPISSEIQPKPLLRNTPTRDEFSALFILINRARALNGWKMQDEATLEKRILLWWDELNRYRIPLDAYKELFDMAFDERQRGIANGQDVPIETALLISCWTRPYGLKDILKQREIDSGRLLTSSVESQCPRCFGTGLEIRFDESGRIIGVIPGRQCEHRPGESHN